MLSSFDWIRRSRSGSELLATLQCLASKEKRRAKSKEHGAEGEDRCRPLAPPNPDSPTQNPEAPGSMPCALDPALSIGPPISATEFPCQRCWVYPRMSRSDYEDDPYCSFCVEILNRTPGLAKVSRRSIVIWGFANRLPKHLKNKGPEAKSYALRFKPFLGGYVHDGNRFLLMMYRRYLRDWLRELVLHEGTALRGLIQIFPTVGSGGKIAMGDVLCRAIHHEANFPMNQLRVRFFSNAFQLLKPHVRDRKGLLTFEISEFLNLMEMAAVFRKLLRPEEQDMLHELLKINNATEEQFYWGRFTGHLSHEARDMLNAWRIRNWPESRVRLLYELVNYVFLPEFR